MLRAIARFVYRRCFLPGTVGHRFFVRRRAQIRRLLFALTLAVFPLFCVLSWMRIGWRKLLRLKPAVIWGPTPIINIVDSSEILKRLGYRSRTLVYSTYFITDRFDYNLKPLIQNPAVGYWLPNLVFLWSLLKFDVFHFFYDGGLWSGMKIVPKARWLELPLLRLAGKRIVAMAFGADVRVREWNEHWLPVNACQECPEPGRHCVCDARSAAASTRYYRDWCHALIAMGDMHDYVFQSRKDFYHWPIDLEEVRYVGPPKRNSRVRFVHSPNHRFFKGTRFIEAAIASLQQQGYPVELDIVERVSNAEAKRRYAEADVVVAQCVIGWIGYTEIEGMAIGKPVVTYLRNADYLPEPAACPLVSASPVELENELKRLAENAELRRELGRRGRRYVEQCWSYDALAPRYAELHERIWRRNNLLGCLKEKWRDLQQGEPRWHAAASTGSSPVLAEWPVCSDPEFALNLIASGRYGQPPFDETGIPRRRRPEGYVTDAGLVGEWALHEFHALLANPDESSHAENFLKGARWLREHLNETSGVGSGENDKHQNGANGTSPINGRCNLKTQALGLSVLLRAEQMAPNERFHEAAGEIARRLQRRTDEGGFVVESAEGLYLSGRQGEEAPHRLVDSLSGLLSLWEYTRAVGDGQVRSLLERLADSLARVLSDFETPGGVRAELGAEELLEEPETYFVIAQLRALARVTADARFSRTARRWHRRSIRRRIGRFLRGAGPL